MDSGSVDDLAACAEGLGVGALYVLDDSIWVPYTLGAPQFVNRSFRRHVDGIRVDYPCPRTGIAGEH